MRFPRKPGGPLAALVSPRVGGSPFRESQVSVKKVVNCPLVLVAMAPEASGTNVVPHEYSIYWGFGEPLDMLDDQALLSDMASLKLKAREDVDYSMLRQAASRQDAGSPTRWALPNSPNASVAIGRHQRPQTAPATRGSPGSPLHLLRPRTDTVPFTPSLTPQQEAREKRYQQQMAQRQRGVVELEHRWRRADAVVAERREEAFNAARARVDQWDQKRSQGRLVVVKRAQSRAEELKRMVEEKERRLAERREKEAEAARARHQAQAAHQAAASARFAENMLARDSRMADAERRVAERLGAKAAKQRAELEKKSARRSERDVAVLAARQRVEREQRERSAATAHRLVQKSRHVEESLLQRSSRPSSALRAFVVPMRPPTPTEPSSSALPGGSSMSSSLRSTLRSPRSPRTTPRSRAAPPKLHAGTLGLEVKLARCALCELEVDQAGGVTYLKRVGEVRAGFGDDALLRWVEKKGLIKMYEQAPLCVFCCQFFQQGWGRK